MKDTTQENREFFVKALREALELEEKEDEIPKEFELSNKDKQDLNRISRIYCNKSEELPYPEVDTRYERIKTKIICIFHIKGYFHRWKWRKHKKGKKEETNFLS